MLTITEILQRNKATRGKAKLLKYSGNIHQLIYNP